MKHLLYLALGLAACSRTLAACPPVDDPWLRLHIDIREGKLERLDCLITPDKLDGHDPKDGMQSRPLHLAARYNQPRVARYLIDRGADPNSLDFADRTPLRLALGEQPADETAALLIERGANIEAPDGEGRPPLYWAIVMERPTVAKLLLARGADRDKPVGVLVGEEYQRISVAEFGRRSKNKVIRSLFTTPKE